MDFDWVVMAVGSTVLLGFTLYALYRATMRIRLLEKLIGDSEVKKERADGVGPGSS